MTYLTNSYYGDAGPFDEHRCQRICDGCNVREPWEHRCHGEPCRCAECHEIDLRASGGPR